MSGLCVLAGGAEIARFAVAAFTLSWLHSVERVPWAEDWRIAGERLELVEVRLAGSGAGMEIPPGSTLVNGLWHHRPDGVAHAEITLAHSPYAGDYRLCLAGGPCVTLADLVPPAPPATVVLTPCRE